MDGEKQFELLRSQVLTKLCREYELETRELEAGAREPRAEALEPEVEVSESEEEEAETSETKTSKTPAILRAFRKSFLSHKVAIEDVLHSTIVETEYQRQLQQGSESIGNITFNQANFELWIKTSIKEIISEVEKKEYGIEKEIQKEYKSFLEQQQAELLKIEPAKVYSIFDNPIFRKIDSFIMAEFLDELNLANLSPNGKCQGKEVEFLQIRGNAEMENHKVLSFIKYILGESKKKTISNAFYEHVNDKLKYQKILLSIINEYKKDYTEDGYGITKHDILMYLLTIELQSKIFSHLNPEIRTLEMTHTFQSKSLTEYLANFRLSNEDRRRQIAELESETETREDKKFDGLAYSRGWGFGTRSVLSLEEQQVTANFARSDILKNIESYERIMFDIEKLKSEYSTEQKKVTDSDIATIIKNIVQCKDISQSKLGSKTLTKTDQIFLTDITNLIFGTEARRNPRMLVHSAIIIDLIIDGRLSFKDTFDMRKTDTIVYKIKPKTPKKAVQGEKTEKRAQTEKEDKKTKWIPIGEQQHIEFSGGMFPMSIGKDTKYRTVEFEDDTSGICESEAKSEEGQPVQSARFLNELYSGYVGYTYQYEGEKADITNPHDRRKIEELVKRESDIIREYVAPRQWTQLTAKLIERKRLERVEGAYEKLLTEYKLKLTEYKKKDKRLKDVKTKIEQINQKITQISEKQTSLRERVQGLKDKKVLFGTEKIIRDCARSFYEP
ncbi:MAG: hypothetical protein PHY80_04995 [Rickettsiales bacterium]|nr:hypothetical protein [Rickettsiales bacterium]